MLKTIFSFFVIYALFSPLGLAYGNGSREVPDFSDKDRWTFVEEGPLIYPAPWAAYEIGRIKKYRHITDTLLVGFEEFIFGSEKPFWKRWGLEHSQLTYHALKKKGGEGWIVGPPGSPWDAVAVFDGTEIKGVWFILFVPPQHEAFGRYFPVSGYLLKEPTQPENLRANPIAFTY